MPESKQKYHCRKWKSSTSLYANNVFSMIILWVSSLFNPGGSYSGIATACSRSLYNVVRLYLLEKFTMSMSISFLFFIFSTDVSYCYLLHLSKRLLALLCTHVKSTLPCDVWMVLNTVIMIDTNKIKELRLGPT